MSEKIGSIGSLADSSLKERNQVPGALSSSSSVNSSNNPNSAVTIGGGNAPAATAVPIEKNVQFRVMRLWVTSFTICFIAFILLISLLITFREFFSEFNLC